MNKQELLNKVWKHLRKQGRQARNPINDSCAYRGDDGTTCAIGCLISDRYYNPSMEGCTAGMIKNDIPLLRRFSSHFLNELQSTHDNASEESFVQEIDKEMKNIAKEHGLKPLRIR